MNDIGIGILDVFSEKDLNNCLESIPDNLRETLLVVSNQRHSNKFNIKHKNYKRDSFISGLRNKILSQFRILNKKYIFILKSNVKILNQNIFTEAIERSKTFGTVIFSAAEGSVHKIEDTESDKFLPVCTQLNDSVFFILSSMIKYVGYFNENYIDNGNLDILEMIYKARTKNVYPKHPYFLCFPKEDYELTNSLLKVKEDVETSKKIQEKSLGVFYYYNQYAPSHKEPQPITKEQLLDTLTFLQKNYAQK